MQGGGSNMIIAIVVGAVMVIVGLTLWPILNGSTQGLYAFFQDSCKKTDGTGNNFNKVYGAVDGTTNPKAADFNTTDRMHGGGGFALKMKSATDSACSYDNVAASITTALATNGTAYNEYGDTIAIGATVTDLSTDYEWVRVNSILRRFAGINDLLLTILPVVSVAGFLGISGAKLWAYSKGAGSIGSAISSAVFTLIGIVVTMVIAVPIMQALVDANQVVDSGQYSVNSGFGNIISLLFGMFPVIYIAGLVGVVGYQAKAIIMGAKGG